MPIQLDIFEHSRDVMLNNAVVEAWLRHDLPAVQQGIALLREEFPAHVDLPQHDRLRQQLHRFALGLQPGKLSLRQTQLREQILPLAESLLGWHHRDRWTRPLWRALAEVALPLPYDPRRPECHATAFWLAANEIAEARRAVSSIPSWRRIPQPLVWMTRIELLASSPEVWWPLLAESAWLAPEAFASQLRNVSGTVDALIARFSREFENSSEFHDLNWFPAWLLIHQPKIRQLLRPAEPNPSDPARAFSLLLNLLHLERTGQQAGLIAQRAKLRALAPDIFADYMRSR